MEIERYEPGRSPGSAVVRITCGGDPGNLRGLTIGQRLGRTGRALE
jgi:hypothetical protein